MDETIQTEKRREKEQIKVERPSADKPHECSKNKKTSQANRPRIPINNHWTFIYMGLIIAAGYLGIVFKEYFVTEELLERYEIGTQNLSTEIKMNWDQVFNVMRFYQVTFYDILLIAYLIKQIKTLNDDEQAKVKQFRELQMETGKLIQPIMEKLQRTKTINNPDISSEEQKIFRQYYETAGNIEAVGKHKKEAYHNVSADYLRNCWSLNIICATLSAAIYFFAYVYIRPDFPPFGQILVTTVFGIQFFSMYNYIFAKVPSTDLMFRKVLITCFLFILFTGRIMEIFSIANYQKDYPLVVAPVLCGIATKFLAEFLNDTKPFVWLRDVVYVAFFQEKHKH